MDCNFVDRILDFDRMSNSERRYARQSLGLLMAFVMVMMFMFGILIGRTFERKFYDRVAIDLPDAELYEILADKEIELACIDMGVTVDWEKIYAARQRRSDVQEK